MRSALVIMIVGGLCLAGCSKPEEAQGLTNWEKAPPLLAGVDEGATPGVPGAAGGPGGGFGGPGGGPGTAAAIPAAAPGTVPVRKAGLWQTTANTGRGGPQSGQLCVDDQTELRRGVFSQVGGGRGGGGQGCEPKIAKRPDGSWTSTMSCTRSFGENTMKMSSSQTLTGDLNARYQVKGTSTTSGGPTEEMNGTRQVSASGSYVGACPSGMRPGDFKGADGQVRNVMQQGGGGRGPGGGFGGPGGGRREGGGDRQGGGEGRREGGRPQGAPQQPPAG